MRDLRIAAAKTAGPVYLRSALSFGLQCAAQGWRQDPLAVATGTAAQAYASARWSGQAIPSAVEACLLASSRLSSCQRPWAAVRDPIAALTLALERICWKLSRSGDALTDEGARELPFMQFPRPSWPSELERLPGRLLRRRRSERGLGRSGRGNWRQPGDRSTSSWGSRSQRHGLGTIAAACAG